MRTFLGSIWDVLCQIFLWFALVIGFFIGLFLMGFTFGFMTNVFMTGFRLL